MTHETIRDEIVFRVASDRVFGLVLCSAFAIYALRPVLKGKPVLIWALAVSAGFLATALLAPSVLHPLNLWWTRLGVLISRVTTPLITTLLFFAVFVPAGLISRTLGKSLLRRRIDSHAETYWVARQPGGPPAESMHDQF